MSSFDRDYANKTYSRKANKDLKDVAVKAFAGVTAGAVMLAYATLFDLYSDPENDPEAGSYDTQTAEVSMDSGTAYKLIDDKAKALSQTYNDAVDAGKISLPKLDYKKQQSPEAGMRAVHNLIETVREVLTEGFVEDDVYDCVNQGLKDLQKSMDQYGSNVKPDYGQITPGPHGNFVK